MANNKDHFVLPAFDVAAVRKSRADYAARIEAVYHAMKERIYVTMTTKVSSTPIRADGSLSVDVPIIVPAGEDNKKFTARLVDEFRAAGYNVKPISPPDRPDITEYIRFDMTL